MPRKIPDDEYLKLLLPSLNVDELKEICRSFNLKGYSRYGKNDLIEFIMDSTSEEEQAEIIKDKELTIISNGINKALDKIRAINREIVEKIKISKPKEHEIELSFRGMTWKIESYISIKNDNITNPERYCDCRIGSAGGFCPHFWVGFIISHKKGYFKLKDWNLTWLPKDFNKEIENISISSISKDKEIEELSIFDEGSGDLKLMKYLNSRITVYDGTLSDFELKEQDFQGNITKYYLATLKNGRIGPQIKKKSDYDEAQTIDFEELKARISENKFSDANLKKGNVVTLNGGLNKDTFLNALILKRVTKIKKK